MKRCTSRPLVASVIVFIAVASVGRAQDAAPTGGICDIVDCVALSNQQLLGVFGFEPAETDESGNVVSPGTTGRRLAARNLAVANILSQLDIDGDGVPDRSPDTDGDGLPDNWEVGGFEALTAGGEETDRVVFFPAPSAIVPGTPPTPIFTRLAVATSALNPDTDGDGLSDFVEVFGLMFIDENRNGLLDVLEWRDTNNDGLPSPGEFPEDNSQAGGQPFSAFNLLHDFDGFVFTDPTNPDTDGDGESDGEDRNPLINLRAFGNSGNIVVRLQAEGNPDIDQDGLGNAMDMGNDLVKDDSENPGDIPEDIQAIDNPANVGALIRLFRQDLEAAGVAPEAAIEDLFGIDWDGNGLWRITDVRTWHLVIEEGDPSLDNDFDVGGHKLFAPQSFEQLAGVFNDEGFQRYGGREIGMGWQDLLRPTGGNALFLPDRRVWAILYAWRMPGFDIDGDGFVGVPNLASTAPVQFDGQDFTPTLVDDSLVLLREEKIRVEGVEEEVVTLVLQSGETVGPNQSVEPFDDRIKIGDPRLTGDTGGETTLDGRIEPPDDLTNLLIPLCGGISPAMLLVMALGLAQMRGRAAGSILDRRD